MTKRGKRRNLEHVDDGGDGIINLPSLINNKAKAKSNRRSKPSADSHEAAETDNEIDVQTDSESDDNILYRLNSRLQLNTNVDHSPSLPTRDTRGGSGDAVRAYPATQLCGPVEDYLTEECNNSTGEIKTKSCIEPGTVCFRNNIYIYIYIY